MERTMTLDDGTRIREGDKVRAEGESAGRRVCKVLTIDHGYALLTAPTPFGTVWRRATEITAYLLLSAALAALSSCATLRAPVVALVRADVQTALDSATAAGDQQGVQCHTTTLATLAAIEAIQTPQVRGVASLAEAKHIKRIALLNLTPMLAKTADECARVYDVMSLLRPFVAGWGL